MSTHYEDWTDWAGDHPQEVEAELRAEREKAEASFARAIRAGLLQSASGETVSLGDFTQYADDCEHAEVSNQGVCTDCGDEVEGWEPSDAQIFAQYGQTKVYGDAA